MSQNQKFHQVNLHVDNDAALIFQHSLVQGGLPLTIRSGANQITWGYSLLTKVTPTYGGEVQQILGARIEQLEITGNTRDNHQLEQIYDWFRAYMTMASGFGHDNEDGHRDERPITFSYPARRWQFDIQVIDASGFAVGTGLVATPWKITAIIVPHGENQPHILEKTTMNDLTSVLLPKTGIPIGVGYNVQNPYSDAAYGGTEADLDRLGHTIGENFQRLLGAYSVGDFTRFAFEGAAPSTFNNLNQESKDYWTSIYGTDIIPLTQGGGGQTLPGGAGSGGSSGGYTYTAGQTKYPDPTGAQFNKSEDGPPKTQIVAWMASNAIKVGIPPVLVIMAGITESHLCNLDAAHSDPTPGTSSEGFFQQQHQFYDALIPGYPTKPDLQIRAFLDKIIAKKSEFPLANNETTQNAENLGNWIQAVQRSAPNDYHNHYDEAKSLLNQSSVASKATGNAQGTGVTSGAAATGPNAAKYNDPSNEYSACVATPGAHGNDQGIDFEGGGPIYALADGIITRIAFNTGWPGAAGKGTGTIIVYKMTSGSRANGNPSDSSTTPYVYIAEALTVMPGLKEGDKVQKGQKLCDYSSVYPYCETGFADGEHGSAFGSITDGKHGNPSPHGDKMEAYIKHVSGGGQ